MLLTCPNCSASYDVPDSAIGPGGRKVRCRACSTSWVALPAPLDLPLPRAPDPPLQASAAVAVVAPEPAIGALGPPFGRRRRAWRAPLLLALLVFLVLALGIAAALVAWGPRQVAGALGLADKPVPLGIAITRQPDWRMIAGGSELFAVAGRVWNPTGRAEPVPDILAELKDQKGRTVYSWTITRPVAQLGPGQSVDFDGAAVDVPRASQRIAVSFAKAKGR